ncbi:MAG: helix-turn-helix domain-containing protein, partial [Candidatus Eremiobacteraeota bacterium]|nr:helix-turn-helix domain-containing protein [Candidatus Eremiobacteraeota bacterium]
MRKAGVTVEDKPASGTVGFGALLRHYRVAAGLSQEALAERASMSANGIGALERGYRHSPQRETLALLAAALGLTPEERENLEASAVRSRGPRRLSPSGIPASSGGAGTAPLPLALATFIGREAERNEIVRLLRDHRLVTVTGPGGIGKTQTALKAVAAATDSPGTAVHFVGLAPTADPSLIAATMASALGVTEVPNQSTLETLLDYLQSKNALIVLDNCEHLVEQVSSIVERVLANCQSVRILATSRESLKVAGEYAYRLPSLDPASAVELFAERARAADSRFTLSAENQPVVADICLRLEGIPLAIELAAARVGALSLQSIAESLTGRFALLIGRSRAAFPRQQTMRALIDWSYDLLSPAERRLFERLSIFAGGCTLSMAVAVCADAHQDLSQILELLCSLVDKSLLATDPLGNALRYTLPEATRQYAQERLIASGEANAIAQRLASALLQFCRDVAGSETIYNARLDRAPGALRAMRAERANFDEAMYWMLTLRANTELGQDLAWRVPFLRATDALHWLTLALEAVDEHTPKPLVINLEIQLAWCCVDLRDHEKAVATAREAVK